MSIGIDIDIVTHLPGWRLFAQSCLVLLGAGIVNFLIKLYRIRHKFQRMQKDGLVSLCLFRFSHTIRT
jgi:hypothetical protein